jgi:hypothetical protein
MSLINEIENLITEVSDEITCSWCNRDKHYSQFSPSRLKHKKFIVCRTCINRLSREKYKKKNSEKENN